MKGKSLKTKVYKLDLDGTVLDVAYDFNAICELEDCYGKLELCLKAIEKNEGTFKAIRALVYSMSVLRNKNITLAYIGDLLTCIITDEEKAKEVMDVLKKAMTEGMPKQKAMPSPKSKRK